MPESSPPAWAELERHQFARERIASMARRLALAFVPLLVLFAVALVLSLGSGDFGPRKTGGTSLVWELGLLVMAVLLGVLGAMGGKVAYHVVRSLSLVRTLVGVYLGQADDEARRQLAWLQAARSNLTLVWGPGVVVWLVVAGGLLLRIVWSLISQNTGVAPDTWAGPGEDG